jgi:hypothetical protein
MQGVRTRPQDSVLLRPSKGVELTVFLTRFIVRVFQQLGVKLRVYNLFYLNR